MGTSPLPGSERTAPVDAADLGPADQAQQIEVSVVLRHARDEEFHARAARLRSGEDVGAPISREAFEQTFGAQAADIDAVRAFAQANGLSVSAVYPARRTVKLAGTV